MPVIYECDAEGCSARESSSCVVDDTGRMKLIPPPRWRLMDVVGRAEPAVLCPADAERVEQHQRAANDPAPRRPKLGVLDGGKKDGED